MHCIQKHYFSLYIENIHNIWQKQYNDIDIYDTMSNNDNLSTILENEISNIFDNILNYADSPHDLPRNNEDYLHEQNITDVHTLQLNTLNNFTNQYFSQINTFQENARDMLQMIRTTIHQQNVVYSHLLRRNNMTQNTPRTHARNTTNTSRAWNVPQYEFSYEIPQINIPRRQFANRVCQRQLNAAVETIEYNEDMGEERCPITLENFVIGENICRIRHCGHIFKSNGLMLWFQRNVRCPVCRYDVRTYNSRRETTASELPEPTRSSNQILEDISGNLVNTRNIIYDRINNVMRQLQNHLPDNDVPTVYTIDIPIYIDDFSYNRIRNYA
jgi:hypothetical protein